MLTTATPALSFSLDAMSCRACLFTHQRLTSPVTHLPLTIYLAAPNISITTNLLLTTHLLLTLHPLNSQSPLTYHPITLHSSLTRHQLPHTHLSLVIHSLGTHQRLFTHNPLTHHTLTINPSLTTQLQRARSSQYVTLYIHDRSLNSCLFRHVSFRYGFIQH